MSREALEVVTGLRGPEADRAAIALSAENQPIRPRSYGDLPEGTVEYHSMTGGLWLLLGDSHKQRDPDTGYESVRPALYLQFNQGVAFTNDPEKIHRIEGCKKGCELHPRGIPALSTYGIGKSLWRADFARQVAKDKQEKADLERLKANPEQAKALLKQLAEAGFLVPERASKKKDASEPEAKEAKDE